MAVHKCFAVFLLATMIEQSCLAQSITLLSPANANTTSNAAAQSNAGFTGFASFDEPDAGVNFSNAKGNYAITGFPAAAASVSAEGRTDFLPTSVTSTANTLVNLAIFDPSFSIASADNPNSGALGPTANTGGTATFRVNGPPGGLLPGETLVLRGQFSVSVAAGGGTNTSLWVLGGGPPAVAATLTGPGLTASASNSPGGAGATITNILTGDSSFFTPSGRSVTGESAVAVAPGSTFTVFTNASVTHGSDAIYLNGSDGTSGVAQCSVSYDVFVLPAPTP
ncbi:MAG: hypothetical protein AAFU85_11845 [Planctomycetota bacterium]